MNEPNFQVGDKIEILECPQFSDNHSGLSVGETFIIKQIVKDGKWVWLRRIENDVCGVNADFCRKVKTNWKEKLNL